MSASDAGGRLRRFWAEAASWRIERDDGEAAGDGDAGEQRADHAGEPDGERGQREGERQQPEHHRDGGQDRPPAGALQRRRDLALEGGEADAGEQAGEHGLTGGR